MTSNQARDLIVSQIHNIQSQTFLIEGAYKVGQVALTKDIINFFTQTYPNNKDIIWIKKQIDKSRIGLSEIDIIKYNINKTPLYSPYIFIVIEDADFLTKESQNALLKVIEEPSKHSIIFLLGTYHRLLSTIYSRCLTVYLDSIELTDITLGHYDLQLDININPDLLNTIEQLWALYLTILQSDEIEIFSYTHQLLNYPIDLVLFVIESIHFMIALAHNDKTRYTNIRLSKSLNQQLNNVLNHTNTTVSWNYKALISLSHIKSTILFSNSNNILAMEQFLINNKLPV